MFKLTKKSLVFSCLSACLSLGLVFSSAAFAVNFDNMSFMGSYVEAHPTTKAVFMPFLEQVKKDLPGVSFNYFSNNVLYPESESYAVLNDGRVDFAVIRGSIFPNIINLMSIVDVPGMAPNAVIGALVASEVIEKFPEVAAEFPENSVPFTVWTSAAYQLHTIKPIKSLEEIKGKKIIVWEAVTFEVMQKLGASPIRITSTDTYLSLSKGMADGVLCPLAPVRSFKISDVAKYHLLLETGVSAFNMAIFKPLWDDFTPEIQAYFKDNGGIKFALKAGQSLEDGALEDTKWMKDLGHEFYSLSDAERVTMLDALSGFKDEWLANAKSKGYENAEEILRYAEERSQYHLEQFDAGVYGDYSHN